MWRSKGTAPTRKFLSLYNIMRSSEIRLSDDEKQRLRKYRDAQFDETVPYGFVVGRLLDEVAE